MYLTLAESERATDGRILSGDPDLYVGGKGPGGVSIDSRTVREGEWFACLMGKTGRDGHQFIGHAIAAGARGLILSDRLAWESLAAQGTSGIAALLVKDTTVSLGDLARALIDKLKPFVVAITGSVGKTAVKENTAHVAAGKWPTLKSPHNWNTEIGLPLAVFNLTPEHRIAVLECASRGLGQIEYLSRIAGPDVAVITEIGPAHLSEFGTLDNIAKAKWEITAGLKPHGTVVAPGDSPYTSQFRKGLQVVTFGFDSSNDVRPVLVKHDNLRTRLEIATPHGILKTEIPGIGRANVLNALCCTAVCLQIRLESERGFETLGIEEIGESLRSLPSVEGRSEVIVRPSGIEVIFDAYNSNPLSLANALDSLERRSRLSEGGEIARKVAILGDMLELGPDENRYHMEAGQAVGKSSIECLLTVGRLSELIRQSAEETRGRKIEGAHYEDAQTLAGELSKWLRPGDLVLIKASRALALEKLLEGDW